MWPRLGTSKLVSRWLVATLAVSIAAAVVPHVGWWLALAPARVWHGEVWRLITWPFVLPGPMALVFTCIAIYKFGSDLAVRWGDRRLRRFMIEILAAAGIGTCILASFAGRGYVRLGGSALIDVLVIAWARQFPRDPLVLYGLLVVRGRELVLITLGVAILFGLYFGPIAMAPELLACAAAALYPTRLLRR
jgi:membrane associated rhomboid family serine protease